MEEVPYFTLVDEITIIGISIEVLTSVRYDV